MKSSGLLFGNLVFLVFIAVVPIGIFSNTNPPNCTLPSVYCVGSGQEYATIMNAVAAVTGPGDKIFVKGGVDFQEEILIGLWTHPNGTEENPIEIRPFPGENVIVKRKLAAPYIFRFDARWWRIYNGDGTMILSTTANNQLLVAITAQGYYGPLEMVNGDTGTTGFYVELPPFNRSDGVVIEGVKFGEATGSTSFADHIRLAKKAPVQYYPIGEVFGPEKRVWIRECRFESVVDRAIDNQMDHVTVEGNYFQALTDVTESFVWNHGSDVVYQNNVFRFSSSASGLFFDVSQSVTTVKRTIIQNNHFRCWNGPSSGTSKPCIKFHDTLVARNVTIVNNIFEGQCGKDASVEDKEYIQKAAKCTGCVFLKNVVEYFDNDLMDDETGWPDVWDNVHSNGVISNWGSGDIPHPYYIQESPYLGVKFLESELDHDFTWWFRDMYEGKLVVGPYEYGEYCNFSTDCKNCTDPLYDSATRCLTCVNIYQHPEYDCSQCMDVLHSYPNCTSCQNGEFVLWPECEYCIHPLHDFQYNCDQCYNDDFEHPDCVECWNSFHDGATNCTSCLNDAFEFPDCDQCKDGNHDPYKNCSICWESDYIFPDCVHCIHPLHDENSGCASCYDLDFNFPNCTECNIVQRDKATNCTTCLIPDFIFGGCVDCIDPLYDEATDCTSCTNTDFAFPGCTECANPRYNEVTSCTSCLTGVYSFPGCTECLNVKHDEGTNCTSCLNPAFEFSLCDECVNDLYEELTNCTSCVNSIFGFPGCITCANPLYDYSSTCTTCLNPVYSFPGCTRCTNGLYDEGTNCTSCLDPEFLFSACTECVNVKYDEATNCTTCTNTDYAFPGCTECENALHDKEVDCQECLLSGFSYPNCTECMNAKLELSSNCTNCTQIEFAAPECTECENVRYDELTNCTSCLDTNFTMPACSGCINPLHDDSSNCSSCLNTDFSYSDCTECVNILFDEQTDCTSCLLPGFSFPLCTDCTHAKYDEATNCTSCTDTGFSHPGCTECVNVLYDEDFNCTECLDTVFAFPNCLSCVIGRQNPSTDCATCKDASYVYPSCTECLNPLYDKSQNCSSCLNTVYSHPGCTDCSNPLYSEATNCTSCSDGLFSFPDECTECLNGKYNYDEGCLTCLNTAFSYPGCTECVNSLFDEATNCTSCLNTDFLFGSGCADCVGIYYAEATNCTTCTNGMFSFSSGCLQCYNSLYNPASGCTSCINPVFSYPGCTECSNPLHDEATNCTSCGDDLFSYPVCAFCENGLHDLPDCLTCDDTNFLYPNCLACANPLHNVSVTPGCTKCLNEMLTYPACDTCANPLHDGTNDCLTCAVDLLLFPVCTSCENELHNYFAGCTACTGEGLVYPACTNCESGYELENSSCLECEEGYYGPGDGTCVECPSNSASDNEGSTSVTDCLCEAGYEPLTEGSCTPCVAGFFKASDGNDLCEACALGKTSAAGSGSCVDDTELSTIILIASVSVSFVALLACLCVVFTLVVCYLRKRLKKFDEIEDINVILEEQRAGKESEVKPQHNINKTLFEVDPASITNLRKLGQGGGAAIVYAGVWNSLKVAYKCFQVSDFLEEDRYKEFERELEILSSISFPFILTFYGATMSEKRLGIVMELCEKGDLTEFLQKKSAMDESLAMKEKLRLLYEVSSAMMFLHSKQVIHRDLKPENILISATEHAKVMDFGMSKFNEDGKTKTKNVGTSYYMAPEVISGKYGLPCDAFSFSVVCYVVITENFNPYGGRSTFGIEAKIANDQTLRPSFASFKEVPSDMKKFIQKNWEHDPANRNTFGEISKFLKIKKAEAQEKDKKKKVTTGSTAV